MIEVDTSLALCEAIGRLTLPEVGGTGELHIFRRMIEGSDPNPSVGVFLSQWQPQDRPAMGTNEPSLGRYTFHIQTYVKASVREEGELWSMTLAKKIRALIYRDAELAAAIGAIREQDDFMTERTIRFGVENAEYQDTPIPGALAFFSQTTFWLDTEIV